MAELFSPLGQTRLPAHHKRGESDYAGISTRELLRLLAQQERESRMLERTLASSTEQLKSEAAKAAEGERQAREVARKLRSINDARAIAQNEADRVSQELRLYKAQLEAAQREILRAQDVLDSLERERMAADQRAADARNEARKLKEEKLILLAREEGRRAGLAEGLRRGRIAGYAESQEANERRPVLRVESGSGSRMKSSSSTESARTVTESERTPSPAMSQPMLNFASAPATVVSTAAPEPLTPSPPPSVDEDEIHPTIVHDPPPPVHHPPVVVPPDGWVPHVDNETGEIGLPPPHELERPIVVSPGPPSRPPSADQSVLMVPPPRISEHWADPEPERRGHRRRRSSTDSVSTTFSQLDLIAAPDDDRSSTRSRGRSTISRNTHVGYDRELSVIPEASPASAIYHQPSLEQIVPPPGIVAPLPDETSERVHEHEWHSSPDSNSLQPPNHGYGSSGSSKRSSMSSVIGIIIQEPSRPPSSASMPTNPTVLGGLLSPDDANRPLPPIISPVEEPSYATPPTPVLPSYSGEPIILSGDAPPPGFVATPMQHTFSALGPPPSSWHEQGPPPGFVPSPMQTIAPQLPTIIREPTRPPSAAPSAGGTSVGHSTRRDYVPVPPPGEIYSPSQSVSSYRRVPEPGYHRQRPSQSSRQDSYGQGSSYGRQRAPSPNTHRRYSVAESDNSSEVSSSIGDETDALATPPPRTPRTPLMPLASEPPPVSPFAYSEAPLPPGVSYPSAPPSQRGGGIMRPPSSAASSAYDSRAPSTAPIGYGIPRPPSSATSHTTHTTHTTRTGRTGTTATRAAGVHVPSTAGGDTPRSSGGTSLSGSAAGSSTARRAFAGSTPGPRLERIDESGSSDAGGQWGSVERGARVPSTRSALGRYAPSVASTSDVDSVPRGRVPSTRRSALGRYAPSVDSTSDVD